MNTDFNELKNRVTSLNEPNIIRHTFAVEYNKLKNKLNSAKTLEDIGKVKIEFFELSEIENACGISSLHRDYFKNFMKGENNGHK